MKTKLIFSTETKNFEQWTDLPFIPHINEWFNLADILKKEELIEIIKSARYSLGDRGKIQSVEYRHDDDNFYIEVYISCEG
jgi:hypothetical protein